MSGEDVEVTAADRIKIKLLPIFSLPTGENFFKDIYHRFSAVAEVLGYPTPRRHKTFFEKELKDAEQKNPVDQFNVLLLGAMSPSSILDALEIVNSAKVKSPSLTVIDISGVPLEAAKNNLDKIASKMGIKLNLVQTDLKALSFQENLFNAVLCDQVYNLLPTKDWLPATNNIMPFVAPGGRFVNVIATFAKGISFLGEKSEGLIEEQKAIYPDHTKVEKLLKPFNLLTIAAGPYQDQTAITIEKPIARKLR